MSFFTWQAKYETGIESIDNDHRKLVAMIDQLFNAMSKGEAKEVIEDIVNGLTEYSLVHFTREEVFMKSINFASFEKHKKVHDSFIEKVKVFKQKLEDGQQNITVEVVGFLRDWLINHIQYTDREYINDFTKFGIK
jgi:hemerythrin-like metal-binding protein